MLSIYIRNEMTFLIFLCCIGTVGTYALYANPSRAPIVLFVARRCLTSIILYKQPVNTNSATVALNNPYSLSKNSPKNVISNPLNPNLVMTSPPPSTLELTAPSIYVSLDYTPLSIPVTLSHVKSPKAGAIVLFAGNLSYSLPKQQSH